MGQEDTSIYRFAGFVLDPTEGLFDGSGSQLKLRPKELNLLVLLVSNAGKLIAKGEILERIWSDVNVTEGNLTTTIANLRKALRETEENPYIENVPKRGYRFVAPVEIGRRSPQEHFPKAIRKRYLVPAAVVIAVLVCVGLILWPPKPPCPKGLLSRAIDLERQGNDSLALDALNELLRQKPECDEAIVHAAWIEYQDNDNDTGLKYVRAITKKQHTEPENPRARCTRLKAEGLELLLGNDPENALRRFQLASEADPTDADALYYWSDLASDLRSNDQADDQLTKCLQIDRTHPGCIFDRLIVRIRQARFNEAVALYGEAMKDGIRYPWLEEAVGEAELGAGNFERALEHFRRLEAAARQSNSNLYFLVAQEGIADIATYQGRISAAERLINSVWPTSRSLYDKAAYLLYLAQIDALMGRRALAQQEVSTAIQTSPFADFHLSASRVLAWIGDVQGAQRLLQQSRAVAADRGIEFSATEEFIAGADLRSKSNLDQSIKAVADAYRIDPDPMFAYYLGQLQMQSGNWSAARESLKQVLNSTGEIIAGDSPALLIPLAERDLGICEKSLGNSTEAMKHFTHVKALWSGADHDLSKTLE